MDLAFYRNCAFYFVNGPVFAQLPERKPAANRYVRLLAQPDLFMLDFVYPAIALADAEQLAVLTFGGCNVCFHIDTC